MKCLESPIILYICLEKSLNFLCPNILTSEVKGNEISVRKTFKKIEECMIVILKLKRKVLES